jgi:hypothetical protein
MAIADELRRLKMRKSAEQQARERRAAKRDAGRLQGRLKSNRDPGQINDRTFLAQLDRKAAEARERAGDAPRPDLDTAIAAARLKGHLPAAHSGAVAPVPTVEDVLGDQAKPRVAPPLGGPTEYLRDPDEILNGAGPDTEEPVAGSSFTRAELDEINRMNPRPSGQQRPKRK